jgi:4-amino-4-deoxy-L-arabinose transferase-like glycosyltransferase
MILGGILFWAAMAFVVGVAAQNRGRSGVGWFLVSLFVTPIITGLLLLALPRIDHEVLAFERSRDANFRNLPSFHEPGRSAWERRTRLAVKILFLVAVAISGIILYFDHKERELAQQQSLNSSPPAARR